MILFHGSDRVIERPDIEGLISRSEAIGRLAMEKPNLQICFRRQEVLDHCLKFERSFEV